MTQRMAEPPPYSEDDYASAQQVVEALVNDDRDRLDVDDLVAERSPGRDVSARDLQADLREFNADLAVLERLGIGALPGVHLADEPIPMSLDLFSTLTQQPLDDLYDLLARAEDLGLPLMETETARRTVLRRAADFLAVRIGAVRDLRAGRTGRWDRGETADAGAAEGSGRPLPGCLFEVSTNTHGLGVNWSGAYRLSSHYFGAPSTPTRAVLQSGRYLFGVDGGVYGQQGAWSTNVVTLPGIASIHLSY